MLKVLYVEDNVANRMLVRQVLEMAGYQVIDAHDGLSGIKTAREELPDLILMDINIPGMDGYETTTRIKSIPELSQVPIIALTAKTMAGDRERALTAGCDGYIAKPIDVDALPKQIADFLEGRRETVTLEQANLFLREYNQRLVDHLEQQVEALTEANKQLAHTDAMKSRFINLAAHELRTPLTAILGYLGLLTAPGSKHLANADPDTQEIIEGVSNGVERLRGIVQDMLDVTRIEAGTLQLRLSPVGLASILEKIEHEFEPVIAEREQTLAVIQTNPLPTMWADGERVTQILRNLVSNAIKYTPDGGKISINAAVIERHPSSDQRLIKITISDTGVGIPDEQQEHIFENFYEVRELEHHSTSKTGFMGGGAGLGLPIARGVAEAHGGSLWVESPGYNPQTYPGSTFHLILPLDQTPKD